MEHERTDFPLLDQRETAAVHLESYLYDTRRIDPLARRQARLICRGFDDAAPHNEAHIIVLLVLAALRKGTPRADRDVLLGPLSAATTAAALALFRQERYFDAPWFATIDTIVPVVSDAIDNLFTDPSRLAPVFGCKPQCSGETWPLLIVDAASIGFSRYYSALSSLETRLLPARLAAALDNPDPDLVAASLKIVFIDQSILPANGRFHFRQLAAAALACRSRFLIISGGPGTGKTSVVIQLLRTLLSVFPDITSERIVLCAPTGRAKARLGESIDAGIETLGRLRGEVRTDHQAALQSIKRKTLHGLLGMRPDGSFKYSRENMLPFQVVVVDEASMVDVHLFAALLEALPDTCRLVLVGDMHQLPSVEAGALLGDLTERFSATDGATLSSSIDRWIRDVTGGIHADSDFGGKPLVCTSQEGCRTAGTLLDRTVILSRSYRTRGAQLSNLAHAVNCGDTVTALGLLSGNQTASAVIDEREGADPIEEWLDRLLSGDLFDRIRSLEGIITTGGSVSQEHTHLINRVLSASTILTLSHEGQRGRNTINTMAATRLRSLWGITAGHLFFHGLPVVLGANHHDLDIYNGDLGLIVGSRDDGLKAIFPRRTGSVLVAVERLSELEIAFALTVHKSQGSEFDNVMLVLPQHPTALLSRQMVYTGITRAKTSVTILGTRRILEKAISCREARPGGVRLG